MRIPEIDMSSMSDHDYSDSEIKLLKMRGTILLSVGVLLLFFSISILGKSIVSSIFLLTVVSALVFTGLLILGDKKLPSFLWPTPVSQKSVIKKGPIELFPDGRRLSDIDIDELDTERPIHEILSS